MIDMLMVIQKDGITYGEKRIYASSSAQPVFTARWGDYFRQIVQTLQTIADGFCGCYRPWQYVWRCRVLYQGDSRTYKTNNRYRGLSSPAKPLRQTKDQYYRRR